jgi:ribonuclease-3
VTTAVDWCLKVLGYRFTDEALLAQALTHRSAASNNNERLEFLGDSVLGLSIAHAVYTAKPDIREGGLSRFKSGLVRRETLFEVAQELDLGAQLIMGSGERGTGGPQRSSILANGLEAVFGAIFLDGGFAAADDVILRLFGDRLANLPGEADLVDPKTRLQEYLQSRKVAPPDYSLIGTVGADHAKTFEVICRVPTLELEVAGTGTSRRRAEQAAATHLLEQLLDD